MPNKKNNRRGFTIVELLLYMSLLAIFILVLVELLTSILNSHLRNQRLSASAQDSRFIMQRIFYEFNNSENFDTTISQYSVDENGRLIFILDYLNSPDTTVTNFSLTKVGNSVQVKYRMNEVDYQTTINKR